jgi:molecular chaperone DnaK (HSP70)
VLKIPAFGNTQTVACHFKRPTTKQNLMTTEVTISSLMPELQDKGYSNPLNTTYVGIDFGTSTTVVSVAKLGGTVPIQTFALNINQIIPPHNSGYSADKVPSVIAWYNDTLYIGKGAADLKHSLTEGKNVWYSFKMKLGEDLGKQYYKSDLNEKAQYTIDFLETNMLKIKQLKI